MKKTFSFEKVFLVVDGIVIGQVLGSGDERAVRLNFTVACAGVLLCSPLFTIIMLIFDVEIASLLGANGEIVPLTADYPLGTCGHSRQNRPMAAQLAGYHHVSVRVPKISWTSLTGRLSTQSNIKRTVRHPLAERWDCALFKELRRQYSTQVLQALIASPYTCKTEQRPLKNIRTAFFHAVRFLLNTIRS